MGSERGKIILQTFVASRVKVETETSKKPNYREKFSLIGALGTVKEAKRGKPGFLNPPPAGAARRRLSTARTRSPQANSQKLGRLLLHRDPRGAGVQAIQAREAFLASFVLADFGPKVRQVP
jgi:hypothetical protein